MSSVVQTLLPMSATLMMSAAVRSSFLVLRTRPSGRSGVSFGSPSTSGITATPVSNPDMPSASLGKSNSATPTIAVQLPCSCRRRFRHAGTTSGRCST
jgi:hypothetical protein